jgi:hypothetical protein
MKTRALAAFRSFLGRVLLMAAVLALASAAAPAVLGSDFERSLEGRWLGAWVVTTVESYSDCAGTFTDNTVNGRLVSSHGRLRFRPGELGRVEKLEVKHSHIEVRLSLAEPLLLSRQEGPFTLYDEGRCGVELDVEVPRSVVKSDDVRGVESALAPLVQRYDGEDEARQAKSWNHRQREAYPPDYQRTLAQYNAWKAQRVNENVQARLDQARDEAAGVGERLIDDPDYLAGLAKGADLARASLTTRCGDLVAREIGSFVRSAPTVFAGQSDKQTRWARGFNDGQRLVHSLSALRALPGCFVQVAAPSAPPGSAQY